MSHASRSHDAFERLEDIKDQLAALRQKEEALQSILALAQQQAELALLLADIASVLRDYPQRNLSEGQRLRINGVKSRIELARQVA